MKRFKLRIWVLCLLAAAGFAACSDSEEPEMNLPSVTYPERAEIVGCWKVTSWLEQGKADESKVDTYWKITESEITVDKEAPTSYTFDKGVLAFGRSSYRVTVGNGGSKLTLKAINGPSRVIDLVEVDRIPDEPEEPDTPEEPDFKPIGREELYGDWRLAEAEAAPAYAVDGIWSIDEKVLRIDQSERPYEYVNDKRNVLTFDSFSWLVAISGEAEARKLTLTAESGAENGRLVLVPYVRTPEVPGASCFPTEGMAAYKDVRLEMTFNEGVPQLGRSGKIRIFDAATDKEVDCIDIADVHKERVKMAKEQIIHTAMDVIGNRKLKRYRIVYYDPVKIEGSKLYITPHYDVLEYEKSYYVTIDREAVTAAGFEGVDKGEWRFTTKAKPTASTVTVGAENTDFRTVQAALDYGYDLGRDAALTIEIAPGDYEEQLFIRYNNNLTIKGMGATNDDVCIHFANCDNLNGGVGGSTSVAGNEYSKPKAGDAIPYTGGRSVLLIESCDNVRFENLTLENSWYKVSDQNNQSEVLYNNDNNGDNAVLFVRCKLLSRQDTLNLKGYCWFYDCLVAGDVDFIWGGATAALFEKCEIRSVTGGGYILQARVSQTSSQGYRMGFVFMDCELTAGSGVGANSTYLARKGDDTEDNITFLNCRMGSHIKAEGWHPTGPWHPETMNALHGLKEYNSMDLAGRPLDLSKRNRPSYILSAAEAEQYYKDRAMIFKDYAKKAKFVE